MWKAPLFKEFFVAKQFLKQLLIIISLSGTVFLGSCDKQPNGVLLKSAVEPADYRIGKFTISLSTNNNQHLTVKHADDPDKVLWQSAPGKSFVSAGIGTMVVEESKGSFLITDDIAEICEDQSIESIEKVDQILILKGTLNCEGGHAVSYRMVFSLKAEKRLGFDLRISGDVNRAYLTYASDKDEHIFGFGEQFSKFDLKGELLPIFIMEQGVGRGAQPITWGADLTAKSGGDWHTTYAGVPHYLSSKLRSLFLENSEYLTFDMRKADRMQIKVAAQSITGQILSGASPLELIKEYTAYTGRMPELPDWIHNGAILGIQGGSEKVAAVYKKARNAGVSVSALWLQDWVGQRTTSFGKQLWWNWELDRNHYPQWGKLKADTAVDGVRLLTYINPFFTDVKDKPGHQRNLYKELTEQEFLVKRDNGKPYLIENTSFSAGLLDLTNPEARTWVKEIIKNELIAVGASGWMADFGEALPWDAVLHKGNAREFHNRYAEEWAKVNREAVQEAGLEDEIVFFSRSGYTRSPGYTTLFWLGDQLVSWDRHDGIKTAVTGLLSSGISGFSLNHSDIGGYTTISNPLKDYHRSKELLLRWMEMNAFTTVFRTHEGNQPSKNHQFHSDDETLAHFARFSKVFLALKDYRQQLVKEASQTGAPVVRHLFLHYPNDINVYDIVNEQFMLGDQFIVAPVLDPGKDRVELYLPAGEWQHLWTKKRLVLKVGKKIDIAAPLGKPAVFYKAGSKVGEQLRSDLASI
jgi:alpha-glucosidase